MLELGFAGIHAEPLRLAGFEVVVVETDPAYRVGARERAGEVFETPPGGSFDAVVAPVGTNLTDVDARRALFVQRDGSIVG